MRSMPRQAPMRLSILLLAMQLVPGCAATPPIVTASNASGCSTLVPNSWRKPVAGAPIPSTNTVGDWIAFGDAQTGRLDMANGRTADSIAIVEQCEARDRAAIQAVTRKGFLGIF